MVCRDIPMAQFIINLNASMPNAQKFILEVLDDTHIFVLANMAETIQYKVQEFRDSNTYEKPHGGG
jgi:TFIIH basal transcription factor complex TTD-A subunit